MCKYFSRLIREFYVWEGYCLFESYELYYKHPVNLNATCLVFMTCLHFYCLLVDSLKSSHVLWLLVYIAVKFK